MKTHQLILLTTALFIALFYDENLGLNFGILGLIYSGLIFFDTPKFRRTKHFNFVLLMSVFSSFAFAWYGDFPSFLALFLSVFLLAFLSRTKELKPLFVIPVFALNFLSFFVRIFTANNWFPKFNSTGMLQRVLSVFVIPAVFLVVFFGIYSNGSSHFAGVFSNLEWNFNLRQFLILGCLGFFIAFTIWNFSVPNFIYQQNHYLKNDFLQEDRIAKPTWSFLDINSERRSGIISFTLLNLMLVFFIVTYNYEQFYEVSKTANQLSEETHERVEAVIFSIIMAVFVILFYFKSNFNFDTKAKPLKDLARVWLILNTILVFSALAKNMEYVLNLGLTYKRWGVFAFLILSLIGLVFTFIKIQKKKTNAYLFNQMIWCFYGTILVCSFVNWGGISTVYNIHNGKGNLDFLQTLNYNHRTLEKEFGNDADIEQDFSSYENNRLPNETWISKVLYYENMKK